MAYVMGAACALELLVAGVSVYAKYFSSNSNKGVATASNWYFSSDTLKTISNDNYIALYNSSSWDGKSPYNFTFQIHNFQNQLLYNDENLDVTYSLKFTREDSGDTDAYSVQYWDNSNVKQKKEWPAWEPSITIEGQTIKGGSAKSQEYAVIFPGDPNAGKDYMSKGIRVEAYVTSPSYVAKKLGGILYAGVASVGYDLQRGFDIEAGELEVMAGFPYEITYMPGPDAGVHQIAIVWTDNVLQLDSYAMTELNVEVNAQGQATALVSLQPYETLELVFYRGADFENNITDLALLEQAVTVTDRTQNAMENQGSP